MTINLQLIMKNHPVIRIRISKAKIAKPNVRLIMIESKSPKQIFMLDHIGTFGLFNYDSLFFFVCLLLLFRCHANNLGVPVSGLGTLEHDRVGLTMLEKVASGVV
jgi:hypothetical protein